MMDANVINRQIGLSVIRIYIQLYSILIFLQYQNISEANMQIFVRMLNDENISLFVRRQDTIQTVKRKIFEKKNYEPDVYRLIHAGKDLEDNLTVQSYCIFQGSTIFMVQRLRGGIFQTIKFNSMSEPIIGRFSKQAPDWKIISRGLNLNGVCKNSRCKAFNKKVWIPKPFGKLNMTMEVYKSPCPICKEFCQEVQNMGLYQARCISKGRIRGEKDERERPFQQTKKDEFLTFEDKDETRVDWLYLEMEVLPL